MSAEYINILLLIYSVSIEETEDANHDENERNLDFVSKLIKNKKYKASSFQNGGSLRASLAHLKT